MSAVVTPSRTDRQPPNPVAGAKGGPEPKSGECGVSDGLIILNSSEVGTEKYQTALAASAIRGAERTMTLCDNLEKQGRTAASIEWLRATFAPFATSRYEPTAEDAE